jgi:hypothetical protein
VKLWAGGAFGGSTLVIKFHDVDKGLCLLNDMNEEQKAMFDILGLQRYQKLVSTKLPQMR